MVRRTQAEADKTRNDILQAARKLFELQGYSATTIDDIAGDAGVTKGAVFHHFSSKEKLFTEVWTELQTEMDAIARAASAANVSRSDPYAAFLAGARVYMDWVGRRDYQQIVLIDGPAVLGVTGWYERDSALGSDNVLGGVRYLIRCGIIAEHRLRDLAILFQSLLNGAGFALARGQKGVTADSLFDTFEMLLRNAR